MNINKIVIVGSVILSFLLGCGLTYISNIDLINFANEHKIFMECKKIIDMSTNGNNVYKEKKEEFLNSYLSCFDNYTYYYKENKDSPKQITDFVNRMPTSVGSGFKIEYNTNNELIFTEIISGKAASNQGINVGDKIIAIDNQLTIDHKYEFAKKLLGKNATIVNIIIERNGEQISIDFVRENTLQGEVSNLSTKMYEKTLYIDIDKISYDNLTIYDDMLDNQSYESIILDLRNNSGGFISVALTLADRFISDSTVSLCYYNGDIKKMHTYEDKNDIDVPIVVLVNDYTASSAEIVTGLLKQYHDAIVIGNTTYGKGVFQEDASLEDGGILHYTAGYCLVGEWECYQDIGISPDIEIEMDVSLIGTDDDIQLKKALEILS